MYQEGELSTALREAGTLCVPVTGMREDMRLELCVGVLATLTVCPVSVYAQYSTCFLHQRLLLLTMEEEQVQFYH